MKKKTTRAEESWTVFNWLQRNGIYMCVCNEVRLMFFQILMILELHSNGPVHWWPPAMAIAHLCVSWCMSQWLNPPTNMTLPLVWCRTYLKCTVVYQIPWYCPCTVFTKCVPGTGILKLLLMYGRRRSRNSYVRQSKSSLRNHDVSVTTPPHKDMMSSSSAAILKTNNPGTPRYLVPGPVSGVVPGKLFCKADAPIFTMYRHIDLPDLKATHSTFLRYLVPGTWCRYMLEVLFFRWRWCMYVVSADSSSRPSLRLGSFIFTNHLFVLLPASHTSFLQNLIVFRHFLEEFLNN